MLETKTTYLENKTSGTQTLTITFSSTILYVMMITLQISGRAAGASDSFYISSHTVSGANLSVAVDAIKEPYSAFDLSIIATAII